MPDITTMTCARCGETFPIAAPHDVYQCIGYLKGRQVAFDGKLFETARDLGAARAELRDVWQRIAVLREALGTIKNNRLLAETHERLASEALDADDALARGTDKAKELLRNFEFQPAD